MRVPRPINDELVEQVRIEAVNRRNQLAPCYIEEAALGGPAYGHEGEDSDDDGNQGAPQLRDGENVD